MTIKIEEKGIDCYTGWCGECGAKFTYERDDVINVATGFRQVKCPHCGHLLTHTGKYGAS